MRTPTREELRAHPPAKFRAGRNVTKADILLWENEGDRAIVKDYAPRPFWIRFSLGRVLVRREIRAYRSLASLHGIPRLIGQIDRCAFAVEFVDGPDLSHFRPGELSREFFVKLGQLVEAVHQAGVAQGDLHHRDILVGPGDDPYLIDFSTAQFRKTTSGSSGHRLFRAACSSDQRAVLKLKRRYVPNSLTDAEIVELSHPPVWYRLGKAVRRLLRGDLRRQRKLRR